EALHHVHFNFGLILWLRTREDMSQAAMQVTGPVHVRVAVSVARNVWVSQQATLHYESSRLIRADGAGLTECGPRGLTGTLYLVADSLCRDNRRVMRLLRQKIV